MKQYENPFYHQYVFTEDDLTRKKIRLKDHPRIWFRPTYVQGVGDHLFHYRTDASGLIYLLKIEKQWM